MSEAENEVWDITTNQAQVTWVGKPPPRGHNRYDWESVEEQLRSRPGEWARIFENGRVSVANALRQGSVRILAPSKGFEVRTRDNVRTPVHTCTLFMRYVPEKDQG